MSNRKEQVYTKIIKDFVSEHNRMPTEGELHQIARRNLYVPMTTPVVPKDKAISNPKHFRNTLRGLLDDGYDIMELIENQKDVINQLHMSIEARNIQSAANIRESIYKVRLQETLEDSKVSVPSILPDPIETLSENVIRSAGSVTLSSDHSFPIEATIIEIIPFTDKAVKRYQLEEFSFPYTAIVEGENGSSYSGIQFQMLLSEEAFITKLHYEGSPTFATIEIINNDEPEWSKIVSINLTGQDDIAISTTATRLRITLTQDLERCSIRITDLKLFQERYAHKGVYVAAPIKLDEYGILEFDFDQYIPENTEVFWQYANDIPVSGDFKDSNNDSVFLDSPYFGNSTYVYAADGDLTYSDIVGYDLEQPFQRPVWKTIGENIFYNIESGNLPEFTGTKIEDGEQTYAPRMDIAVIPKTALDNMISITYGKNAWIFRVGNLERAVIDEVGLRRLAMTGYPHWMTHLLVDNDFDLSIDDPNERIAYAILELEGNVLILERPFQYTLVKGIWKCTLVMDEDFINDQGELSETTAILYSDLDPRTAVNTEDSSGSILKFYIQPFPVPMFSAERMRTDIDYTDYQRAGIELRNDGKHIIVPDISVDPTTMGIISTTITLDFLENIYTSTNIPLFYDITYMMKVASPAKYIFVRAQLSTSNRDLTPIIRGISLSINDTKREPPALVKRLKREGAIKPLPE